jgi:hypothetical protein
MMEATLMTEMMSGVEHAEDTNVPAGLDGLDERLIGQLVDRARANTRNLALDRVGSDRAKAWSGEGEVQ